MTETAYLLAGVVVGVIAGVGILLLLHRRDSRLQQDLAKRNATEIAAMVGQLKEAFGALSREALSANADDFLKLAKTRLEQQTTQGEQSLEGKKKLIDARLGEMSATLTTLGKFIQSVEKQRAESFGSLTSQLQANTQATSQLQTTTAHLREALASPQARGQWGERMAEDVLRLAGFIKGVNYEKQQQLEDGGKPDFSFPLPGGHHVHMDVKFPLDNYMKVQNAPDDATRALQTKVFLRDVRARIKEVTTRAYIDPAAGTVDYVIVFIPIEQIYAFIHEHDPSLLDDALRNKVVLCSPLTLYAILAVIRQASENFRFEQGSRKILELLAQFKKQWEKYGEVVDRMGRRLDDADKAFRELVSVRTRALERQLDKIDDLQAAQIGSAETTLEDQDAPALVERAE
ncbi:MAG: DNA recombination protein RmuC [Planctomycetes bacterium]|nr:DNA recombination protein RmuC [Planctomycetota bacterium]